MKYEIKHLSDEELQAIKARYPETNPKLWTVSEGNMVLSYEDTEEDAKAEVISWQEIDRVGEAFDKWAEETADALGIEESRVRSLVKDSL